MNSRQVARSQSGQIAVEYALLLVVAVAIAALITTRLVSRSEEEPGFVIAKWAAIINAIGADLID